MSDNKKKVRNAVLGADRAFGVIDGGKGKKPPPPSDAGDNPCPIVALGDNDGTYFYLDTIGQLRKFSAQALGKRENIISLFRGNDIWLRDEFPVTKEFKDQAGNTTTVTVDFQVNRAAKFLIAQASQRGLFGDNVTLRKPGIWRTDDGLPAVHCGDAVLIGDDWKPSGTRTGNQIWAAAEATPRPAMPCDDSVARKIQSDLQDYWSWANPAGPIAVIGLLHSGYVCGALDWRTNAFVTGSSGAGKTTLLRFFRNAWPVHDFSSDATRAGMEQALDGRALPAIIDEASDRNRNSGRDLVDIVLSAGGGEGTKVTRGTTDGKGRKLNVLSSVIMFSINPPELEPQHLNRFVMIELQKPTAGADHKVEHQAIASYVKKHAAALWGRAIGAHERYNECLASFREALRDRGCDPREMDGKGALLAGWFVLTHNGLPDDFDLREGVAALGEFIITAKQAAMDDGPKRALHHLLTSLVQLHRSTDKDPVGKLVEIALGEFNLDVPDDERRMPASASELLANYGIRPIRKCTREPERRGAFRCGCTTCYDSRRQKHIPRGTFNAGIWIANRNPELQRIFLNTPFDGGRWRGELTRLPGAIKSERAIRIGSAPPGYAFWLDFNDLFWEEPDDP